MQEHDMSWVRTEMVLAQDAPKSHVGPGAWARKNLFASPTDSVLTIIAVLLIAWAVPHILNWLFFNAIWSGADRTACLTTEQGGQLPEGWSGACWPFVSGRFGQFMFGRYPLEERWRPILTGIVFVALLVPLLTPRAPFKRLNAILFFVVFVLLVVQPTLAAIVLPYAASRFLAMTLSSRIGLTPSKIGRTWASMT